MSVSSSHSCFGFINLLYACITSNEFDHTVVIIHTHSDDITGDLFFTSQDEKEKTPLSTGIESVSLPSRVPLAKLIRLD